MGNIFRKDDKDDDQLSSSAKDKFNPASVLDYSNRNLNQIPVELIEEHLDRVVTAPPQQPSSPRGYTKDTSLRSSSQRVPNTSLTNTSSNSPSVNRVRNNSTPPIPKEDITSTPVSSNNSADQDRDQDDSSKSNNNNNNNSSNTNNTPSPTSEEESSLPTAIPNPIASTNSGTSSGASSSSSPPKLGTSPLFGRSVNSNLTGNTQQVVEQLILFNNQIETVPINLPQLLASSLTFLDFR